ncbi:mitochondrial import inner membrane translocase subunit Tim29 [Sitophilus oryzae]|uniref:Mitochondrial import inner membrane translocase subunit Tim29 n=1 Tax=Sitophilus oryzae TaxID=7048 RepID=A0A6J2XVE4_SITOR|nr:mitochondrial import inner membrane translocase subunit Tim29 [Sitophilus oryzae]
MVQYNQSLSLISRTLVNIKSTNLKFNEKIKGTIVEKWVAYWKLVAKDYKDVGRSLKQDIKTKPLRSGLYFTGASLLGLCASLNPDMQSFRAKYIQSANDLGLVPTTLANPQALNHLKYIERSFNHNLIRYINLGVLSIIWVDKFSEDCNLYENTCSYLQVPFWEIRKRMLDIGFLNVWWITSRKMLDYDINY